MDIPKIGLGTWGMGGKYESDLTTYEESVKILKYGLNLGYQMIDTAELYGRGLAEKIVGETIQGFDREKIYIISKVWIENLEYDAVIRSAKESLERMKIDYIDLYLIHWSMENYSTVKVPLSETMAAMEFLVREGLIKNIGVSNATVEMMKEAEACLKNSPLAANQIEYNFFNRSAENDIIPYCRERGIKIIAHRPLAKGKIPIERDNALDLLSKKYKKTPAQIALNWIISQNIVPIPKAGSREHLVENFGALNWEMAKTDIDHPVI